MKVLTIEEQQNVIGGYKNPDLDSDGSDIWGPNKNGGPPIILLTGVIGIDIDEPMPHY